MVSNTLEVTCKISKRAAKEGTTQYPVALTCDMPQFSFSLVLNTEISQKLLGIIISGYCISIQTIIITTILVIITGCKSAMIQTIKSHYHSLCLAQATKIQIDRCYSWWKVKPYIRQMDLQVAQCTVIVLLKHYKEKIGGSIYSS